MATTPPYRKPKPRRVKPTDRDREMLMKRFTSYRKPPRSLPSGASAQPKEDSGLFNPLVHGNRNPGRYGTRKRYRRYLGPSRGR